MAEWNWVEIEHLVKDMTRVYRTMGHKKLSSFERARSRRGLRCTAKCPGCGVEFKFEIVMGQVEPRAIYAFVIDYCTQRSIAKAKKGQGGGEGAEEGQVGWRSKTMNEPTMDTLARR